jgi:hypothetical protein
VLLLLLLLLLLLPLVAVFVLVWSLSLSFTTTFPMSSDGERVLKLDRALGFVVDHFK